MFSPYEPRYGDVVTFGITARIDAIVGRSNARVTVILKTDAGRMYEAVYGADGEVESLRACGRDHSCAVQEHNPEDRITVTTHKPLEVYSDDFKGFLEFNTYGPTCPKCGERDCGIDHSCALQGQSSDEDAFDRQIREDAESGRLDGFVREALESVVEKQGPDAADAARYRWLRDGNAFAPEEKCIEGGPALDHLCDEGVARDSERNGT